MKAGIRALRKNDRIALFSPSSEIVSFSDRVRRARNSVESLGLKTVFTPNALVANGRVAGSPRQRAADIMQAFNDQSICGLMATTGGYSALSVLEFLDYSVIAANPKPLIGFSDVTALLLSAYAKCDLPVFHGPSLLSSWGEGGGPFDDTVVSFRECLMSPGQRRQEIRYFKESTSEHVDWRAAPVRRELSPSPWPLRTLYSGTCEGRVICANLETLICLLPTPYMPDLHETVLLLEETSSSISRTERNLLCLALSGALRGVRGIVFGKPSGCDGDVPADFLRMLSEFALRLRIPSLFGLDIGHTEPKNTVPIGSFGRLDASAGRLVCEYCLV